MLSPSTRQVAHALLTRPPLTINSLGFLNCPFDLHVLGTPPAFILSQDQTLMFNLLVQNLLAFTNYFNPCPKSVSRILDFRAAPRVHMQACHSPRYSRILLFKVLFSEFLPDEMTFHLIYSESFRVALLFICQGA